MKTVENISKQCYREQEHTAASTPSSRSLLYEYMIMFHVHLNNVQKKISQEALVN